MISAIINIKDDKDVWYFMKKKTFGAPIKDACWQARSVLGFTSVSLKTS